MTEENTDRTITRGVHHIGLTVPDLEQTRKFFLETLGYDQVGDVPDYPAVFVSDGSIMITLWQASDPASAVPFDRKNGIGLHHLALTVDADAIDGLCNKFFEAGRYHCCHTAIIIELNALLITRRQ